MVVAAFSEVSSAMDKVIHVYTCGITATSQCFLCNNIERIYSSSYPPYSIYLKPHTHTHTPTSPWNRWWLIWFGFVTRLFIGRHEFICSPGHFVQKSQKWPPERVADSLQLHLQHGAMHLHMTNQEATVDDLFIKDFTQEIGGDQHLLRFVLSINVFSLRQMMRLAGGKIASFLDKKQEESVTEGRNWDGCQIG